MLNNGQARREREARAEAVPHSSRCWRSLSLIAATLALCLASARELTRSPGLGERAADDPRDCARQVGSRPVACISRRSGATGRWASQILDRSASRSMESQVSLDCDSKAPRRAPATASRRPTRRRAELIAAERAGFEAESSAVAGRHRAGRSGGAHQGSSLHAPARPDPRARASPSGQQPAGGPGRRPSCPCPSASRTWSAILNERQQASTARSPSPARCADAVGRELDVRGDRGLRGHRSRLVRQRRRNRRRRWAPPPRRVGPGPAPIDDAAPADRRRPSRS